VVVGRLATATLNGGVSIGKGSSSGDNGIAIGVSASASVLQTIAIGTGSSASGNSAIALGAGVTNTVANTTVIGASTNLNIRSAGTTCDLGTTALPFQNVYVNTGIDSTAGLAVGGTNATSVTVGRSGITTTINGIFTCTQATGSWYSTTAFAPSFSAGVNRLITPTAATAGILSEFTHATGVLTYTGTRTRNVLVSFDVSYTNGASGANITLFISKNGSTTLGTQSRSFLQTNAGSANARVFLHVTDVIGLANTDTIQLAGSSATLSSAVSFNFINCNIVGLFN
jgi:hypothetical protein